MRITKKALRANWRDPRWAFHNETTYWFQLDTHHWCLVSQATEICFSRDTGIGYDIAVPGSYTVSIDEVDDRRTVVRSERHTFEVANHAELKRRATTWIYETFKDEEWKGAR